MARVMFIASLIVLSIGLAACGSSSSGGYGGSSGSTGGSSASAAGAGRIVKATETNGKYEFAPSSMTVKAGSKITWRNATDAEHTVTFDSGMSGNKDLGSGKSVRFTFAKPGTYRYHCTFHPYMKGTIKVH